MVVVGCCCVLVPNPNASYQYSLVIFLSIVLIGKPGQFSVILLSEITPSMSTLLKQSIIDHSSMFYRSGLIADQFLVITLSAFTLLEETCRLSIIPYCCLDLPRTWKIGDPFSLVVFIKYTPQ